MAQAAVVPPAKAGQTIQIMAGQLSYCAEEVRRQDWERFICALFAPLAAREPLFALLAFNQEIAKTRESVSEPILGEMRLQWWRDALDRVYEGEPDGPQTGHYVLDALTDAIRTHHLPRESFDMLIDGRSRDLDPEPMRDVGALTNYAEATSGQLNLLMLEILGVSRREMPDAERSSIRSAALGLGTAWALVGQLRVIPQRMPAGPCFLPADLLTEAGLDPLGGWGDGAADALAAPVSVVAELAGEQFQQARSVARKMHRDFLPAMLPAVLASVYLKRLRRAANNPFDRRVEAGRLHRQLRVTVSALRGVY